MFRDSSSMFRKTHPKAHQQEKLMLEELKNYSNYVETEISHHWNENENTVQWFYDFDIENNPSWESVVKAVIRKYQEPA